MLEIVDAVPIKNRLGRTRLEPMFKNKRWGELATGPAFREDQQRGWSYRIKLEDIRREYGTYGKRVPALPEDADQIKALLHDHKNAWESTSKSEQRLSTAYLHLIEWLRSGSLIAGSASWTLRAVRGDVITGGPTLLKIEEWQDPLLTFGVDSLNSEKLRSTCIADVAGWYGYIEGEEVSGTRTYHNVFVDLDQFLGLLPELQDQPRNVALIRPKSADQAWRLRVDQTLIEIKVDSRQGGLQRGLRALWLLLSVPNAPIPYILLEQAYRRNVQTRPNEGDADAKRALQGLRDKLSHLFTTIWEGQHTAPATSINDVRAALDIDSSRSPNGARAIGFLDLQLALTSSEPGEGAAAYKTPTFAEINRTVKENLGTALAAIGGVAERHVPGLPAHYAPRVGHLLDKFLKRERHCAVFRPAPMPTWRAE